MKRRFAIKLSTGELIHFSQTITDDMRRFLKVNPCAGLVMNTKNGWKNYNLNG